MPTPKVFEPIAWGQPRSGATPGEVTPTSRTLKGFHNCGMVLCNPCGVDGYVVLLPGVAPLRG